MQAVVATKDGSGKSNKRGQNKAKWWNLTEDPREEECNHKLEVLLWRDSWWVKDSAPNPWRMLSLLQRKPQEKDELHKEPDKTQFIKSTIKELQKVLTEKGGLWMKCKDKLELLHASTMKNDWYVSLTIQCLHSG